MKTSRLALVLSLVGVVACSADAPPDSPSGSAGQPGSAGAPAGAGSPSTTGGSVSSAGTAAGGTGSAGAPVETAGSPGTTAGSGGSSPLGGAAGAGTGGGTAGTGGGSSAGSGGTPGSDIVGTTPFPTAWIPVNGYQSKGNVPQGKVETVSYQNTVLNMTRKASVYTPPGYDKTKKYPVLYALHGIGGDETEWLRYNTNVDQIFNNLYAAKKIEPMIVVFPNGRAMNPDRAPSDLYGKTNTDAFYNFWDKDMKDFLIPFIDKTFPTYTDRYHRAIMGYSMGGGQAIRFGLGNTSYFAYVGGLGPAFWPDANALNATQINADYKQLFLSTGTADDVVGYTKSEDFHKVMDTKGIKHIWVSVQGGKHDGTTWCPGIYNFAQIIFK